MPIVAKHLISPGLFWSGNSFLKLDDNDLRELCAESNRFRQAGWQVPVPWEHQEDAKPVSMAERLANLVKRNEGWSERYSLKSDGSLWVYLNIEDEKTVKKLPKTVKFVSPQISANFKDGDGKLWPKPVVTHVALTCQPRFKDQQPFGTEPPGGPSSTCLSLASVLTDGQEVSITLSMHDCVELSNPYRSPAGNGCYFQGHHYRPGCWIPKAALTRAMATQDGHRQLRALEDKIGIPEHQRISSKRIPDPQYDVNDSHVHALLNAHWRSGSRRMSYHKIREHLPKWTRDQYSAVKKHLRTEHNMSLYQSPEVDDFHNASNIRIVIPRGHVAAILAAQDLNAKKGKTPEELSEAWITSDRFVLMEVPTEILGVREIAPPGKIKTLGPIIVDVDKYQNAKFANGNPGHPPTLVLDGQHRTAHALAMGQKMLTAYVGEKVLPFVQRAILSDTPIGEKPIGAPEQVAPSQENFSMATASVPSTPSGPSRSSSKPSGSASAPSKPSGTPSKPSGSASSPSSPSGGKDGQFKELLDALKEHGIHLDEHTKPADLVEHLLVAMRAVHGVLESATPSSPSTPSKPPGGPGGNHSGIKEEPATAVAMSQTTTTPATTTPAPDETKQELSFLKEELSNAKMTNLIKEIDTLVSSGRVQPARADKWKASITEHRLSLATPTPAPAVHIVKAQMEMASEVQEGEFWSADEKAKKAKEKSASLSLQTEPTEDYQKWAANTNGEKSEEEAKKLIDWQTQAAGLSASR